MVDKEDGTRVIFKCIRFKTLRIKEKTKKHKKSFNIHQDVSKVPEGF